MNRWRIATNNIIRRSWLFCCIFGLFMLTACYANNDVPEVTTTEATTYEETRASGEIIACHFEENIQTAFFQFKVGTPAYNTYLTIGEELFEIHDGYTFAVCDISITNTGEQDITMFLDDFRVTWKDDVSDYGYGYSTMLDDAYMNDEFVVEPGKTIEKKIMFKVPKDPEVTLYYEECYADDFIGNRYTITLQP